MKNLVGLLAAVLVLVLGCGAGLAQGAAGAAGKRPMTFEDLMAMKRVSDPQISASGKWVMFSVTEVSLEKNSKVNHLWGTSRTANPDGGGGKAEGERQLTFGNGESNGRFSPDGKWVSWTAGDQIVVAAWDEGAGKVGVGKVLTAVSTGADGAVWSPDSQWLLFVSSVYPECSDKAAWAEEDACDKAKDEAAAKSPVKAQVFEHLLYRHWDHYMGEKRSHVLVMSASDGLQVRDLTPRSVVGDAETPTYFVSGPIGYAWAPDSKEIAYVANLDAVPAASTNNDVFTLRLDEAGAKAVKVSTSLGSDDGPAYSPDGKWLAFRSQARAGYESDKFDLVVMDRASGRIDHVLPRMTNSKYEPVKDNWVDEFAWAPDSKSIAIASPDRGREVVQINALPVRGSLTPPGAWTAVEGEFGSLAFTKAGAVIATQMFVNRPAQIVIITHTRTGAEGGDIFISETDVRSLTHMNDALVAQLDLSKLDTFWFGGAEDTQVQGFVVRPPNFDPGKKYPVKFLMHGGPQTAWGDSWSYRWNWELMAASGYVVVGVNRRGSTGYGQKFVDEVSGDWGGKAYVDLMKGLDAAEAKFPFIDKTRECALGASYGGFMADWILTHTDRFKCIVTHDGMYNPAAAYGDTEEMWFNEWEFRRGPATGAAAWDKEPGQPWRYQDLPAAADPFRKWSPMLHIKDAKTPTLVIHSQKDYRLDVSESFQLFTALQRLGVPSKMLYFPDEGHWVLKPQNSKLWYETVGDWCDRWTRTGRYAGK